MSAKTSGDWTSRTEQGAGGVGGLLAVSIDGVFYLTCCDHNGNIVAYVSESGDLAAQFVYDPYGNVIEQYGAQASQFSFGFSTKIHDREISLVSYQRRFYSPDLGRWLNRDPIEEEGGENLYCVCRNNMTANCDSLGCEWKISRDSSQNWASARRTSDEDDVQTLASLLKLNENESSKWLRKDRTDKCKVYVPNVFCLYTSEAQWGDGVITFVSHLRRIARSDAKRYQEAGFKVMSFEQASSEDAFLGVWSQDGIYAVSFAGHGSQYGFVADPKSGTAVNPGEISVPCHLAEIRAYSCLSSTDLQGDSILPDGSVPLHSWRDHVSSRGTFFGYSGKVNWISQFWQKEEVTNGNQ